LNAAEQVSVLQKVPDLVPKDTSGFQVTASTADKHFTISKPTTRFESSAHDKRKSNNVHRLLWFMLLLAIFDCKATTLPGYSVHSSLRMGSHSHTAAEPWALQFGNHSISQYACQGALRPTFIVGLSSCFVFGCGLVVLIRELEKAHNQRLASRDCVVWGGLYVFCCLFVFFCVFLGFTIACVTTHKDTGIDKAFYITAFIVVLLLLCTLYMMHRCSRHGCRNIIDSIGDAEHEQQGRKRLLQAGVSVFVVCTGLFVLIMVLRSDHSVRLDHHITTPIAYLFYTVFFTGVWCIGWALWMRHCKHNAEASIKPEECGVNIPWNATGLAQVFALMINTYSFAGFTFAPSIPWTTTPSSISPVRILMPVMQWYSSYVSAA
jgi:cytochrome bd-type quinol oxidase subunit 2